MQEKTFEAEWGGRKLIIGTGLFAQQADGSCTVQYGETKVLGTVVMSKSPRGEVFYFPLMVDYQEKLYATGKIKGSRFIKREGRPTDEAVLTSRLIDRGLRPLFPQHIRNDIQVIADVLSADDDNQAVVPAMIATACAIAISNIPLNQTLGALRVGRVDGEFVLNPTYAEMKKSDLDLILSITGEGKVINIESGANEITEDDFFAAVQFANKEIKPVIELIEKVQKEIGKEKVEIPKAEIDPNIKKDILEFVGDRFSDILFAEQKTQRKKLTYELADEVYAELKDKYEDFTSSIKDVYTELLEDFIRDKVMSEDKRIGNRALTEIRTLESGVGLLPRVHGTGYFLRGETQVLTITTLGGPGMEQTMDGMEEEYKKRFMHHYNFPPYSVGDVSPLRGPSRRDIGHGALAEKALMPMLPSKEDFPYTIRLVSEVMGSNGSSSMASTCGSSLALMDAGIPIKKAVGGIAMGIMSDESGNYKILTDIQDLEDTEGGMDFKIAGTVDGITAVQMDTKTHGLTEDQIKDTLVQGKQARLEVIDKMNEAIEAPRAEMSPHAPRIISFKINPDKIRDVIGPGGKMINEIIDATGVEIDIEDDGTVMVTSNDADGSKKAIDWIKSLAREAVVGEVFKGKVVRIMNFGAFVEILPGQDGLVHISKLAPGRVEKVEDVVKLGDEIEVKVVEIDGEGRVNLAKVFDDKDKK